MYMYVLYVEEYVIYYYINRGFKVYFHHDCQIIQSKTSLIDGN